jgi:phenol 2-monooxygenase (NADPH)
VREFVPDAQSAGGRYQNAVWGVLDGELVTDFPDIWSKTVVYSPIYGSILIVPRERNLTRFYIELKYNIRPEPQRFDQQFLMQQAKLILAPFTVEWKMVEWFGRYQMRQRVAARFSDPRNRIFIAGDARLVVPMTYMTWLCL